MRGRKKRGIHCTCVCMRDRDNCLCSQEWGLRGIRTWWVGMGLGEPPARVSVPGSVALPRQPWSSRGGAGRAGYLAALWAGAEGRVLGLGTLGGRQGTALGWGCGALPAAPHRGPAALRPSGAGHRPREGASGCSFARPSRAGWTCIQRIHTARRRVPVMCVLSPGIAGERFRGFTPSA